MKIKYRLYWVMWLFLGLSLTYAQNTRDLSEEPLPDESLNLGNQGVLYQKPEIITPAKPPVKKTPAKPVVPAKTIKTPDKKYLPPPKKQIKPEPLYIEEPTKEPAEAAMQKAASRPNKEVAELKEQLENALSELAQANKKVQELQKQVSAKRQPATYYVQKGDSLWKIAKKKEVYGNPYKWLLLYHANRDQLYDPNLIFPYMVLFVPQTEEYEKKPDK